MRVVPRVPPFDRPATYEDLEKLPDHVVAEIVDGELHSSPRPALRHARSASRLGSRLGPPFDEGRDGPGGWIILYEPELHLSDDVVVPDLAGWRQTRLPSVPNLAALTLAPDWLCEVLSPSTSSLDRLKKLRIYAREGVGHVWLIDPIARTLEVLRLENSRWSILAVHGNDETVRAEPFQVLEIDLQGLWPDPPDAPAPVPSRPQRRSARPAHTRLTRARRRS
jgi:Uma2 family endonuclease